MAVRLRGKKGATVMSPTVLYAQNVKYNSAEAALFL